MNSQVICGWQKILLCPNSFCTDFLKKIIIDVYFKNVILIALAQFNKNTKGFFF
jgi:hypothetical protein